MSDADRRRDGQRSECAWTGPGRGANGIAVMIATEIAVAMGQTRIPTIRDARR